MLEIKGIVSNLLNDERLKVIVGVPIADANYDWFVLVPPEQDWQAYVAENEAVIIADVTAKIAEWETTDKETPLADYVQPEYPDYWAHRKNEYPSIGQQLDALWKGGQEASAMKATVQSVKDKYPKAKP
jgi:hypothetical protein